LPRGKHNGHRRGAEHPRWNTARIVSTQGYVKVRVGRAHPLADPNGYAYEHLLVCVSAGNPRPGPDEVLHHRNEDKTDNRIGNLELLTKGAHNAHHNARRKRDTTGRFVGAAA
jgi:HNH endonuclease